MKLKMVNLVLDVDKLNNAFKRFTYLHNIILKWYFVFELVTEMAFCSISTSLSTITWGSGNSIALLKLHKPICILAFSSTIGL